jgi:FkbM family methyltransferase
MAEPAASVQVDDRSSVDTVAFDRGSYISSPLPIEGLLHELFDGREDMTIFDIGACEGEDSVKYARAFPRARIYAVEPVPANVARCRLTIDRYGASNVHVLPFALSESSGVHSLHISSGRPPWADGTEDWDFGNKSSSLLEPSLHRSVHPWVEFTEAIEVTTLRLDQVCHDLGVTRIDFIHLDVQGAELMVLTGAGKLLSDVTAIWLEVEAVPLYRGQPLAPEVEIFMQRHGFWKRKDTVDDVSGDQLWLRSPGV